MTRNALVDRLDRVDGREALFLKRTAVVFLGVAVALGVALDSSGPAALVPAAEEVAMVVHILSMFSILEQVHLNSISMALSTWEILIIIPIQ